jgi:hypothetical protein
MSHPRIEVPLPWPVEINLSRPAMECIVAYCLDRGHTGNNSLECELDNFTNLLQNLLERSETEPGNLGLVGG